ncbi:hypothetical protein GCM10007962_24230 [Yeosuana aromativorans]|uniref:DNA primase n=1 Tax=Yeosuana aromativorans TaxID=288019 RepID=A0A8J3BRW1_9FLAO|nr:hypothetical protein [Yeosuana aromativorans]GGK29136.1 hypothetical protein GCM10007962_24230 [Yeosuana aromativorans]
MKRIIVDYKKLTPELLKLLTEKFPDGYSDKDIITFDNHRNETVEAVQITTDDTIYLVKVSSKLHYTMTNFDSDDFEVDELGNVVVDPDLDNIIEPNVFSDEEE